MNFKKIQKTIEEKQIKFVDLRFTDSLGKEHHVSVPVHCFTEELVANGHPFDGSSIAGWQGIESSDMILRPDLDTVKCDMFYEHPTLFVTCDVFDPRTNASYIKCPRGVARRAEQFLLDSKIGDCAYFGPEAEFFVFDEVKWNIGLSGSSVQINAMDAAWSSNNDYPDGNIGHRPSVKGGYFPLPPVDYYQDLRSEITLALDELGIPTELHHHEVATAGQCEIGTKFSSLTKRADWSQIFRYVVKNMAHRYGKTATFMPKPIVGDNGSGMHVHQSIWKNGKNIFAGNEYAKLSKNALYYIGGIIKHARALNAITNPTTNSYKRLVPGFEAPVILTYSACNRSAAIRIPHSASTNGKRIEVRFPDPLANPYLAFSAMLMAGIDGIINKIDPGKAMDVNLYELSKSELAKVPTVASSLDMALQALSADRAFLTRGGVFSDELIDSYIALKEEDVNALRMNTHPIEFAMYYSM